MHNILGVKHPNLNVKRPSLFLFVKIYFTTLDLAMQGS